MVLISLFCKLISLQTKLSNTFSRGFSEISSAPKNVVAQKSIYVSTLSVKIQYTDRSERATLSLIIFHKKSHDIMNRLSSVASFSPCRRPADDWGHLPINGG
jgi:hypothetical protein